MQPKHIKAAFVRGKRAALSAKEKINPYHPTVSRHEHEAWSKGYDKWFALRLVMGGSGGGKSPRNN